MAETRAGSDVKELPAFVDSLQPSEVAVPESVQFSTLARGRSAPGQLQKLAAAGLQQGETEDDEVDSRLSRLSTTIADPLQPLLQLQQQYEASIHMDRRCSPMDQVNLILN